MQRSLDLARQVGYTRVFTIEPTMARPAMDQFAVGRVQVDPDDWPMEFRLKATRRLPLAAAGDRRGRNGFRGFAARRTRMLQHSRHEA